LLSVKNKKKKKRKEKKHNSLAYPLFSWRKKEEHKTSMATPFEGGKGPSSMAIALEQAWGTEPKDPTEYNKDHACIQQQNIK